MGWTVACDRGSIKDMLKHDFPEALYTCHHGNTYYMAMKEPNGSGVYAMVVLTAMDDGHPGYHEISEDMGPFHYHPTKKLLDMLTPTKNKEALEWRAACRAELAKPKLKDGIRVKFDPPLQFGDGVDRQLFDVMDLPQYRGLILREVGTGFIGGTRGTRSLSFTVVDKPAS